MKEYAIIFGVSVLAIWVYNNFLDRNAPIGAYKRADYAGL